MFLSRPSEPVSVRKANPNHGKDGRFTSGNHGGTPTGSEKVRWHRDIRTREGWKKGDESLLSTGKVSPTNGVAGGSTGHPYVAYVPKRHDASDSRVVIYGYKSYHYNPKGNVETTRYRLFMGDKEIAVSDTFSSLRERMYSTIAQVKKASNPTVGSMVTWNSSGGSATGKIERIVREGTLDVPNSSFRITAEQDDPAVLIRVYRNDRPTSVMVGHKMSSLNTVAKANPNHGKDGRFVPSSSTHWSGGARSTGAKRSSDTMSTDQIRQRGRGRVTELKPENRIGISRGATTHSTPNGHFSITRGPKGIWNLSQNDGLIRNHGAVGASLKDAVIRAEEIIAGITLYD